MSPLVVRICAVCDHPLTPMRGPGRPAKYCSDECRHIRNTRARHEASDVVKARRTCAICKGKIPPRRNLNAKYCSSACFWRSFNERHREHRRELWRAGYHRRHAENPELNRARDRDRYARNVQDEAWVAKINSYHRAWDRARADARDKRVLATIQQHLSP